MNYCRMKAHGVSKNYDKMAVGREKETAVSATIAAVDSAARFQRLTEHSPMYSALSTNCSKCAVFEVKLTCANFQLTSRSDLANAWNGTIIDSYHDSKLAVKRALVRFAPFFVLVCPTKSRSWIEKRFRTIRDAVDMRKCLTIYLPLLLFQSTWIA